MMFCFHKVCGPRTMDNSLIFLVVCIHSEKLMCNNLSAKDGQITPPFVIELQITNYSDVE